MRWPRSKRAPIRGCGASSPPSGKAENCTRGYMGANYHGIGGHPARSGAPRRPVEGGEGQGAGRVKHLSDAERARDLRLALAWIAALLVAGSAANLLAIYFGAAAP